MEVTFWVWLAIIVVSVIVEIATLDLVSVWFAVGSIVPFILSAIGGIAIEIQISVFVVVTAVLIIFLRKYAQKLLFKNMNDKTNLDMQIGKIYRLLEDADFEKNGLIKINDVVWTAVSEEGNLIKKGQLVEVVKVNGNKMFVKLAKDETTENIDEKIESIQDNNKEKKENVAEPNENQSQNEEDKKLWDLGRLF